MEKTSRDRLKKKIKDKKAKRTNSSPDDQRVEEDPDIFSMINQVQSILKNNPEMVAKVSSCVNSLMSNPEMMEKLSSQINQPSSQTLQRSSSGESSEAVSKES
jgi:hypothetical protein